MLDGTFRYRDADHAYFVGNQRVPGIRTVLRVGGVEKDLSFLDPVYQQRGKAVHAATMQFDLTGEDSDLPADWQPFYNAYKDFRAAVPCRWRMVEATKVNRGLGYASRLDRMGTINGYEAVVELKTGGPSAFHGPQLAGLDLLLGRGQRRRFGVYLLKSGRHKLVEYTDPADYITFLSALRRYWEVHPCDQTLDVSIRSTGTGTGDSRIGATG